MYFNMVSRTPHFNQKPELNQYSACNCQIRDQSSKYDQIEIQKSRHIFENSAKNQSNEQVNVHHISLVRQNFNNQYDGFCSIR